MISWKSKDGAEIEGVLHKPADFQPGRKYPLLVIIHGGPTGDLAAVPCRRRRLSDRALARPQGAVVLEPNYRGSAGYGEKFRSLNVRNLGIGDAWDVLSGIDHSSRRASPIHDRVGVMGWSQGGYISAFLHHEARRPLQGDLGRRRHLGLDDVLRQHRHSPVHAAVPEGDAVGRSGDLRGHVADDLHQAGEDADADPARRSGSARADSERVRALSGPAGSERAGRSSSLFKGFGHG